jgi:hypothetical protein
MAGSVNQLRFRWASVRAEADSSAPPGRIPRRAAHDERPSRAQVALLAGLALPILGGISSLLLPIDDILPLEIRRVHIAEIFGSNFLFGVVIASLLVRRT